MRDSLDVESAVYLGSRLPAVVRGLYYEEWNPLTHDSLQKNGVELISRIRENLGGEVEPGTEYLAISLIDLLERRIIS